MEIIYYFKKVVFENYANFKGRARRSEYWYFTLAMFIINMVLQVIPSLGAIDNDGSSTVGVIGGVIFLILGLAVLIPTVAVTTRRLHDTGLSGWWILLSLVPLLGGLILLIFCCRAGKSGPNKWGPDPKNPESNNEIMKAFEG